MFTTEYLKILDLIDQIDPVLYGKTRNYLDGRVTKLSPYISRGVISTKQIAQSVLRKGYQPDEIESFLKELAWRDYFQQVWIAQGDQINVDIKQKQNRVSNRLIAKAVVDGNTGIEAVDRGISELYETGYMHNHMRMYLASISCNIAQSHWLVPAQWMYYHLLDADWASNALSWQWVVGSFSQKKYFANQENINKYCQTNQTKTFMDVPYEAFETIYIPNRLQETQALILQTKLPISEALNLNEHLPIYVYNFYNLDVNWCSDIKANKVLLLEPSFFDRYPVSEKTIDFLLSLAKNISSIQIVVGEFDDVFEKKLHCKIHFKEHPTNAHYKGQVHERDWMFKNVKGYYPSFFAFWKEAAKDGIAEETPLI